MSFWCWAKWWWALTPDRSSTNEGKWTWNSAFLVLDQLGVGRARMQGIMNASNARGKMGAPLYIIIPVSTSWWRWRWGRNPENHCDLWMFFFCPSASCFKKLVCFGVRWGVQKHFQLSVFLDVSDASRRTVSCRRWIPRLSPQNSKGWGYQISRCRRTWMTPIGEAFIHMGLIKIAITWNPLEFWMIQEFSCAGDQQHHHRKHGHGYGSTAKMNRTERNEVPKNETYADPTWCGKTPFHFTHFCRWKLLAQPRKIVVENVLTTLTGGSWELGWDWQTDNSSLLRRGAEKEICWWKKTWAKFKVACVLNGHYLFSSIRLFTNPAVPLVNHHFSFELASGKLTWLLKITIFNG